MVLDFAVAPLLDEAVVGTDIFRAMDAGSIHRQQQITAHAGHFLKDFPSLQLMQDVAERSPNVGRQDFIQCGTHLGVAGNRHNAVNAVQALGLLMTSLVKGEQGRILERKHSKGAHQNVIQRDRCVGGPMIGYPLQILADVGKQGVGIQMSTHFDLAECLSCLAVTADNFLEGRHGFDPCNFLILRRKNDSTPCALSRKIGKPLKKILV